MSRPRFVAGDLGGGLIDEIPFASAQHRHVLGGPGGWTATIPHDDRSISGTNRARLAPNRRAMWFLDDTDILFGGIVRQPSLDLAETGIEDLTVGGEGLWGYYRGDGSTTGRFWRGADTHFAAAAFTTIVAILTAVDALGNIGLEYRTSGGVGPAITAFDLLNADAAHIGTTIEQLCTDYAIAFDTDYRWDTTVEPWRPVAVQSFHYPRRGRDTNVVLEHGRNVDLMSWAEDGSAQANDIVGIGAGALRANVSVAAPGFPLLEAVVAKKDITSSGRLNTAVTTELNARAEPARTLRVEVREDARGLTPKTFITGDTCLVSIDDGYIVEDGTRWRVDAVEVNYDTEGESKIAYELSLNPTSVRAVPRTRAQVATDLIRMRTAIAAMQRLT